MKKIINLLIMTVLVIATCVGCSSEEKETNNIWKDVIGSYSREDSSQFSNGVLNMKYLDGNSVMVEIKLMEGSESEESAIETVISGVMKTKENLGTIKYDSSSINFEISEDLKNVEITHEGNFEISPDGKYSFLEEGIEVSDESAVTILNYLPKELTGIEEGYVINPPESLVEDWFYPVNVTYGDSIMVEFIIAKDMSAVYRLDADEPTLIYGSAKNMLEAQTYSYSEFEDEMIDEENEYDQDEELTEMVSIFDEPMPLVFVESEKGTLFTVGEEGKLVPRLPWNLPYTIISLSDDSSIVSADGDTIKGISEGETTITGKIIINEEEKDFSINILVVNDLNEIFE